MRSLRVLMADALVSCNFRGHDMSRFEINGNGDRAVAECKHCGAYVQCLTHPRANEIDIGGSAVAIGCTDRALMDAQAVDTLREMHNRL
jgi:transcription elongation factor Elf1